MSSNDDSDDAAAQSKRRRIQRACDTCRRKKVRCDGAQMPGNRCSNCITYGLQCSYVETARKRGPPKRYVESIETRVEKIEQLLKTILPEADLADLSGQIPSVNDQDDIALFPLTENLQRLSLNPDRDSRFFGRSSGTMLLQAALDLRVDIEPQNNARRHTEFWASRPAPEPVPPPRYNFPPPDLAASLIDLYFARVNLMLPVLHRPTFARDLAAGLHLTNDAFAATFLVVCAIGSRFSSDPRVLLDGADKYSSGWRWFEQLQLMRDLLGPPPCLYDIQFNALSVIFLQRSSAPQACWTLVSIGIRMAQDVGAHRRKATSHQSTSEDELWKRAFWVLVVLDRTLSVHCGRPCAIQDEDFDLDFPIDCDDEYWEAADPEKAFQQPKGKPSHISAFVAYLRLCQIMSFALRTIYSINSSKVLLGLSKGNDSDWEHRIVVELDSALNKWMDDLPDHLRWNPTNEHLEFFEQSAVLHCSYYYLQILIHRLHIPSPSKVPTGAFPSLAICLNAARSCTHVADTLRQRMGDRFSSETQIEVFTAAIILLLNIWGGTRSGLGLSTDSAKEMADVQRCMQVLSECEKTWPSAGKLWDALSDLANVEQVPLPANVGTKNKRDRGAEEPKSATTTAPYSESAHDLVSPPDSSSHSGHAPAPAVTVSRRWTDGPDIVSGVGAEGGRPFAGRRLQTSDVPAIMTQFLPHLQHRSSYPSDSPLSTSSSSLHQSPAYISETPLSSSSLHGQHGRFVSTLRRDPGGPHSYAPGSETTPAIHQKFVPSERSDAQYRRHAPPDSASSVHSPHPPPFVPSMYRADDGHRMPNTPLSASSIQEQLRAPYVPSVNERLNLSYPQSREILDDRTRARGEDYWYSDEGRRGEPSPVHLQHRPMVDNHPPRLSAPGSSSFPMSEAFYEHITASFSAAANGGHGHYEEHPQNQYSDADASIHGIPHGAEPHPHVGRGALDDDAMALWSAAPIGYDTNASEWNTYLDTVNNMAQARMHTGGHGPM